jgi:hypothetical protein
MIFNLFIRIAYEKYFVYESLNLYVVYFAMYDSVLILLLNYGHHDWFNKVFLGRYINAWMHSLKKSVKPEIVNRYDIK